MGEDKIAWEIEVRQLSEIAQGPFIVIEDICKCLKLVSGFCLCPRRLFRCVIFVNVSGVAYWRAVTGSVLLLSANRFRSFALWYDFRFDFRPSWQVDSSVIACILID